MNDKTADNSTLTQEVVQMFKCPKCDNEFNRRDNLKIRY